MRTRICIHVHTHMHQDQQTEHRIKRLPELKMKRSIYCGEEFVCDAMQEFGHEGWGWGVRQHVRRYNAIAAVEQPNGEKLQLPKASREVCAIDPVWYRLRRQL